MDDIAEKSPYWALHFIVKHGGWIAVVTGVVPLLIAIVAFINGAPWWWLVAGALGAAFLFLLMRAFVELVRVMVDMLVPK